MSNAWIAIEILFVRFQVINLLIFAYQNFCCLYYCRKDTLEIWSMILQISQAQIVDRQQILA